MPKGPNGEWRPVGDNECAAHVCRVLLGETPETYEAPAPAEDRRVMLARRARKGGKARAAKLTRERRSEIAAGAAAARESRRKK